MFAKLRQALRAFSADRGGNIAMTFGLTAIPLMGLVGGAVDFHQASRDSAGLQAAFDAATLAAVRQAALGPLIVQQTAQAYLNANLPARLKGYPTSIQVTNGGKTVRITSAGQMPTTFLGVLGMATLNVGAKSTAASTTIQTVVSKKPVTAQLDPEAGDYNRIYVYCYNDAQRNQASQGRSQMTAIADNAGTVYNFNMPSCKSGETLSYRLYNVRNARTQPSLWDTAQPGTLTKQTEAQDTTAWSSNAAYNYYSDTTSNSSGVLTHNFAGGVPILETVICANLTSCKNQSQGGVIPTGRNRTPQQATQACAPGKFLYLGWEDRPPGYGWTDSDYDDIRVIIECPSTTTTDTTVVRLTE